MAGITPDVFQTLITILIAAVMATALGVNAYIGFHLWLLAWRKYIGTGFVLKWRNRRMDLSQRDLFVAVAFGSHSICGLGGGLLVLVWHGPWWLAVLVVQVCLVIALHSGYSRYRYIKRLEKYVRKLE